jgi:hypothetical protein
MGHIKEPKGVDFLIKSDPLTEEAKQEISTFIRSYKAKNAKSKLRKQKDTAISRPYA